MIACRETHLTDSFSHKLGYVHVTGCFPYNVINSSYESKITNRNKTGKMIQVLPWKAYKPIFNEKLIELKTAGGKDRWRWKTGHEVTQDLFLKSTDHYNSEQFQTK